MFGLKVYCMMNSGKPLTPYLHDLLLINGYDMWHERCRKMRLKSRRIDGYIESALEPIDHLGVPIVMFVAIMTGEGLWANQVTFYIRVDDLDIPPQTEFGQVMAFEMGPQGPMPLPDGVEIPMLPFDSEVGENGLLLPPGYHDHDDEPEWDTGDPIY